MADPTTAAEASRLLVIVGPTASGKTALAIALAERLAGEIVSADSVQVYRRFDLGSGKPTTEERQRATHHLIDVVAPDEPIDAARWAELAEASIRDIRARGRLPIVCGGTYLWIRSLVHGLAPAPPADPEIRRVHQELAEREGRLSIHQRLADVDPASAARLAPNDLVRTSRALEVFELTGRRMSDWQAEHGFREARFDRTYLGVSQEREELDARIRTRVLAMLAAGWEDEVRALLADGLATTRAMGSVGYKQVASAVAAASSDRAALIEDVVRATRVFARRQRTWLRDRPVRWLKQAELESGLDRLADELRASCR